SLYGRAIPGKATGFVERALVWRTAARSRVLQQPKVAGRFGKNNQTRPLETRDVICAAATPRAGKVCRYGCNDSRRSRASGWSADFGARQFRNGCRSAAGLE